MIFTILMWLLMFWGIRKIFSPLFQNGVDDAEYAGQLVGWCIMFTIFLALFGLL
jgi:peptidoglycan biosynthesis protein MviN/MurJ (putative lipid II flippase)